MKRLLRDETTLTFDANANNQQLAIATGAGIVHHLDEIDVANQDADLTINEVYIDGRPLKMDYTAFPLDLKTEFGHLVAVQNQITIEASESAGATADVTIIQKGNRLV